MAKQKKIEFNLVTTTKIQVTVDGKKRTVRMWRLPIHIPAIIEKHLLTYLKDAKNEILCELRIDSEWVDYIKSFDMPLGMRAWVTSVIWWHYGNSKDDLLYEYYRSFDGLNDVRTIRKQKLLEQLDLMGISKVANGLAQDRESRRNHKLTKLLELYKKGA
jgi:hypothetical protein